MGKSSVLKAEAIPLPVCSFGSDTKKRGAGGLLLAPLLPGARKQTDSGTCACVQGKKEDPDWRLRGRCVFILE